MAIAKVQFKESESATPEVWMDTTQKTVTAGSMLSGITALKNDGTGITGNIASKSSSDLTASGATVTAPAGYYPNAASKSVESGSATTPTTSITANPTISVNATTGLITSSVSGSKSVTPTVSAGFVSAGTAGTVSVSGSNTQQLSTQEAATITPSTTSQTAVAAGKYTTGAVTVAAMPSGTAGTPTATKGTVSNHSVSITPSVTNTTGYITGSTISGTAVTVDVTELESGTKSITANGTGISVSGYSTVDVDVASGGGSWDATHISTLIIEVGTSAVTIKVSKNPSTMIVAVNWGDGVIDEVTTNTVMSHTYSTGGIKNITILADDSKVSYGTPQYELRDYCVNQSSSVADYNLKSVYYSPINMVTNSGYDLFRNCKSLLTAFLAEGTPVVNYRWFRDCSSLLYAYIPSTVTAINNYAFYNSSLKELVIKAATPPTLGTSVFPSTLEKITVPSASLTDYQTATNWSAYSNLMVGE